MKRCYKCGQHKELEAFGKNRRNKDGLADECRDCKRQLDRIYAAKNREKAKQRAAEWYTNHKDDPEFKLISKERQKEWRKNNLDKHCAKEGKRRAAKLKATPEWLSASQIQEIANEYALSKWCSEVMGSPYHVDHIVPLKGKLVCGLHVPWNLRVIPAKENISKGNKHVV